MFMFLLTKEFLFSCFLIHTLSPHRTMKCFQRRWKQIQWNNFWNWREEGGVLCSILTPFPKQTTTNPPTHPPFTQMEALYSVSICTTGSVHSLSMPWWRMPNILYSINQKTHIPPTAPLDSLISLNLLYFCVFVLFFLWFLSDLFSPSDRIVFLSAPSLARNQWGV